MRDKVSARTPGPKAPERWSFGPDGNLWSENGPAHYTSGLYVEAKHFDAQQLRIAELEGALYNARCALTFYREWMTRHCPEGNGSTTYPFGKDAEDNARAALAKRGQKIAEKFTQHAYDGLKADRDKAVALLLDIMSNQIGEGVDRDAARFTNARDFLSRLGML